MQQEMDRPSVNSIAIVQALQVDSAGSRKCALNAECVNNLRVKLFRSAVGAELRVQAG